MRWLLLLSAAAASAALRVPLRPGTAKPVAPPSLPSSPQVLRFTDPKTRGEVVLVGTMHYNPASIALAADTVRAAAEAQELRAVLVESCPTRWNATLSMQPQGSLLRTICDNEMQAAAEVAEEYGRPVELGDQTLETTFLRLGQLLALTLVQLLTPSGWQRIAEDFALGKEQLSCPGESVGSAAILPLLPFAPVSLVRYPLAAVVKSPSLLPILVLIGWYLGTQGDEALADAQGSILELLGSVAVAAVETIVFGRMFLIGLLEERNFVIARNIRKAHFEQKAENGGPGCVVAVLGLAHLNGIKRVMLESRVV